MPMTDRSNQGLGARSDFPGGNIVLYTAPDGTVKLDVQLERDMIWLNQQQMTVLFNTERSVITKHLSNIFRSGELDHDSVCAKFAHTAADEIGLHIRNAYKEGELEELATTEESSVVQDEGGVS